MSTLAYMTTSTRNAARRLVDALEVAEDLDVPVWSARAAQGACVLVVEGVVDGQRLAERLEARPARFGWTTGPADGPQWGDPAENTSVIIEVKGRPEVHPATGLDSNPQPSDHPDPTYSAV